MHNQHGYHCNGNTFIKKSNKFNPQKMTILIYPSFLFGIFQHELCIVNLCHEVRIAPHLPHQHPERTIHYEVPLRRTQRNCKINSHHSLILHLRSHLVDLELNTLEHSSHLIVLEIGVQQGGIHQLSILSFDIDVDYWHLELLLFAQSLVIIGIRQNSLHNILRETVFAPFDNEQLFVLLFQQEFQDELVVVCVVTDSDVIEVLRGFCSESSDSTAQKIEGWEEREGVEVLNLFMEVRV